MSGREEVVSYLVEKENNILKNATQDIIDYDNYISDKSIRTRINYLMYVMKFKEWANKDIGELSFTDFNNYMNKIKHLDNGKESSCGHRIMNYAALKIYCKVLYLQKIIPENYMENIPRPKFKETEATVKKREVGYLNEDELKIVLSELKKDTSWYGIRDMAIFQVFLNTGMRSSALLALDVENYDPKEGKIINTDKGGKVNTYYLSDDANNYLEKYIFYKEEKVECITNALFVSVTELATSQTLTGTEFISAIGTRINRTEIAKIIKTRTKVIGRELTPHKLRATYGTMLYNKTHDIYFVQKMMNHNSPTTTELYIRGEGNRTKDASNIMSELLKGDR
jgi:integrase